MFDCACAIDLDDAETHLENGLFRGEGVVLRFGSHGSQGGGDRHFEGSAYSHYASGRRYFLQKGVRVEVAASVEAW